MSVPVVTIYRNGDLHFFGKKLVVNPKRISTFDNFLDKVTHDTQAKVAIRRICTPNHGTKILKLEQLQHGGVYVAVGAERFKRLQYNKLRSTHPTLQTKKTLNQNIRPVLHSRIYASARYQKVALAEPLKNRIVFVYRNGDSSHQGIKLLLDKHMLLSMNTVLQYITDKVKLTSGAVKSIHTLDGVEITETKDIVTGHRYVAVGYGKSFIKTLYNQNPPFSVTPRRIAHSKNSESAESSPKYKTSSKLEKKEEPKKDRKWRTHLKKAKEKSPTHVSTKNSNNKNLKQDGTADMVNTSQSKNTNLFEQLVYEIDGNVDHVLDEYHTKTEFFQSSNEYKRDVSVNEEKNDGVIQSDDEEIVASNDKLVREGTFDHTSTVDNNNNNIQTNSDDVTSLEMTNNNDTTNMVQGVEQHTPVEEAGANKKVKSTGFGSTFEKPNNKRTSVMSDRLSDSINSRKGAKNESTERRRSIENRSRKQSVDSNGSEKSETLTRRKTSVEIHMLNDNGEIITENVGSPELETNLINELSGTPPLTNAFTNEPETKNANQMSSEVDNETNKTDEPKANDAEDGTIFKASGEQEETAAPIKDNKDTRIEKTIDMQEAEEVQDEEIEEQGGEDTNKDNEKEEKK